MTVVDRMNDEFEDEINSSSETINALNITDQLEKVTESSFEDYPIPSFMDAIFLAREIVQQKKCARISLAKFISKFYLTPVNSESLRSYPWITGWFTPNQRWYNLEIDSLSLSISEILTVTLD